MLLATSPEFSVLPDVPRPGDGPSVDLLCWMSRESGAGGCVVQEYAPGALYPCSCKCRRRGAAGAVPRRGGLPRSTLVLPAMPWTAAQSRRAPRKCYCKAAYDPRRSSPLELPCVRAQLMYSSRSSAVKACIIGLSVLGALSAILINFATEWKSNPLGMDWRSCSERGDGMAFTPIGCRLARECNTKPTPPVTAKREPVAELSGRKRSNDQSQRQWG
jgi:hypothetical protein